MLSPLVETLVTVRQRDSAKSEEKRFSAREFSCVEAKVELDIPSVIKTQQNRHEEVMDVNLLCISYMFFESRQEERLQTRLEHVLFPSSSTVDKRRTAGGGENLSFLREKYLELVESGQGVSEMLKLSAIEIALRENLDRVDLHPLEEGEGYLSLLEAQLYTSHDSISKAFGKPKSRITECIGFTRLPENTKAELLKRGIKNRSLLRQLLNSAPELHQGMIEEASTREETLLAPAIDSEAAAAPENAASVVKAKKEMKPFDYEFNAKKLNVPGFKWKVGEGNEKLESYIHSLKQLVEKLEDHLTQPVK